MEAEVLYDYDKLQEDELTLRVGNIIHNVKEVDAGWCEGELNGVRGMFPDNFVKMIKKAPSVNLRNGEPERKTRRAKVIYSYAAQCEDELTLELGKFVEILEVEEEGWFKGRVDNRVGVFPSNFVEEDVDGGPAPRAPSPEPPAPEPAVDSQTGERQPPSTESKTSGLRGPMVMPAFDPNKVRAQLKQTSKTNLAPPPDRPPENKKPSSNSAVKPIQRAKVTYDYDAENEDELTVKVGDILDVLEKEPDGQEGWVMARLRDKTGLIADVFYEVIEENPSSQQSPPHPKQPEKPPPPAVKEPSSKQMVPPPAQKKPETKKPPPVIPAKTESSEMEQTDFPVPKTTPLDSSAVRDRPKTKNRPPTSRSNLHSNPEEEAPAAAEDTAADDSTKNLPPWKLELLNKKKQPKLAPKPAGKPAKPPAAISKPDPPPMARSRLNTGGSKPETNPTPATSAPAKPAAPRPTPVSKPKPPETKSSPAPQESHAPATPASSSSTSTTTTAPPPSASATAVSSSPAIVDNSWKEAYEKLQAEFASFKSVVMDIVNTLTDDLDKERKHRAALEIDIDRLKKTQRSLVN